MNKLSLSIVGAVAAMAASAGPARAATFGEWLAYCAGGDATIDAKIHKDTLAACGLDEGVKSACSVLSGTPWTCSLPAAKPKDKNSTCDEQELKIEVGAGFAMPAGWKVAGDAKLSFVRRGVKENINICNTSPVIPTPQGSGGGYSAESGDISFVVVVSLEGMITVTSPVGITANLNAKAGCGRTTEGHFYKKAEVNSCGSPTPSPTTSPTTPPATTPTPGGTPPATPPPTTPTPGGTPPATPPPTTPTPGPTMPPSTPPPTTPTPVSTPAATPPPYTPTPYATPVYTPTPYATPVYTPTPYATALPGF